MHQKIHELLTSIDPIDSTEEAHISYAKKWVLSGNELYRIAKPDVPRIHLVAYCVVIDFEKMQILLGDHKASGLWLPPGGHCDPQELPVTTATRELEEEVSLKANLLYTEPLFLSVTKTSGAKDNEHTDVGFWYVSKGDSSKKTSFDPHEFHTLNWFSLHGFQLEKTDPHMLRFIKKINNYLRQLKK
jgi:8-oxo-dGTP diphosphatase